MLDDHPAQEIQDFLNPGPERLGALGVLSASNINIRQRPVSFSSHTCPLTTGYLRFSPSLGFIHTPNDSSKAVAPPLLQSIWRTQTLIVPHHSQGSLPLP